MKVFFVLILCTLVVGSVQQRPSIPLRNPSLVTTTVAGWTVNNTFSDGTPVFNDILIPEVFLSIYPSDEVSYNYPIFQRLIDTGYFEVCDTMSRYFATYVNNTCEQIFCNASNSFVPLVKAWINFNNAALTRFNYVSLHNYCLYCAHDQITTFRQKMKQHVYQLYTNNDNSTCPHFAFPEMAVQVVQSNVTTSLKTSPLLTCNGQGYAYLHFGAVLMFPYHPYICYCNRTMQFGYQCDAFTYAFIPMRFIIFPYVQLVVNGILGLFLAVFVVIPYLFAKLAQVRSSPNCKATFFFLFGDLKAYSIIFCILSICLLVPEHVLSLAYYSIYRSSTITEISNARIWTQYLSCYFLCLSISFILVLWLRVVNGKPFSILQKCLLVLTYASQIVVFITMAILSRLDNTGIKIASACIVPLYFIIFAIGLFIFGIRIYIQLNNVNKKYYTYQQVPWTKHKFTQFTIIANVFMFILAVLLILLALILYVAWDILSPFMYLFITLVINFLSYVISFALGYLLFSKKMFIELYSICCNRCTIQLFGYQSKSSDALDIVPAVASEYDSEPETEEPSHDARFYSANDKKSSLLDGPTAAHPQVQQVQQEFSDSPSSSPLLK